MDDHIVDANKMVSDREAFEAWWRQYGIRLGGFDVPWEAYQAATQRQQSRIAELESDAALGRQMREAIGNESLARFIEKHGEPVPIMKRVAELEAEVQALRSAGMKAWQIAKSWVDDQLDGTGMYADAMQELVEIRAAMNKEGARE